MEVQRSTAHNCPLSSGSYTLLSSIIFHFTNNTIFQQVDLYQLSCQYILRSREEMFILDLPWEDILIKFILSHLSYKELFGLRLVNSSFRELVAVYWSLQTKLDLSQVNVDLTAFKVLVENCKSLKEANLKHCHWLNDDPFIAFLKANPLLHELNLTECTNISSSCLQTIASHGNQIKNLYLGGVNLVPHILSDICMRCNSIEKIDLSKCSFLDSSVFWQLCMRQKRLMWLTVADCPKVDDAAVLWLISNCATLQYLDVSGCNLRKPVEIIGSVLKRRGKITHLVMTETKLDIDTQENLKMESKSLTVIFKPGKQQPNEEWNITSAMYHVHRANIPSNFQF